MNPKKIVITGGPGTGKTAVINLLEKSGFFCFHEIIRSMTFQAKKEGDPKSFVSNPLLFVPDPLEFNNKILDGRLDQFKEGETIDSDIVFYDRALPDVLAYMDFFGQKYQDHFVETCREHTYHHVFILPPWEEIYISDNERLESFEEAVLIHNHLENSYKNFGYNTIHVPKVSVAERMDFILEKIK